MTGGEVQERDSLAFLEDIETYMMEYRKVIELSHQTHEAAQRYNQHGPDKCGLPDQVKISVADSLDNGFTEKDL